MTHTSPAEMTIKASWITFLYCLPALFAAALISYNYYQRTEVVATFIQTQHDRTVKVLEDALSDLSSSDKKQAVNYSSLLDLAKQKLEYSNSSDTMKRLIDYNFRQHQLVGNELQDKKKVEPEENPNIAGTLSVIKDKIKKNVWTPNVINTVVLALLPFLLLGMQLGISKKLNAPYTLRISAASESWVMKFIVAIIMAFGWLYVLNPSGQGDGTLKQYLISVDLTQANSLPMFLKGEPLRPIIAGFLGWYLYLLTYFFTKVYTNDVLSSNVYGLMLQKFIFTYGVTLILPSMQTASAGTALEASANLDMTVVTAFLVGFFPMSAFSMLKSTGMKMLQGSKAEEGQLNELPGISRMQVMRLEEEGINSIGALAGHTQADELLKKVPGLGNLGSYWIDIARLYTVVGQTAYLKISKHCTTASELVLMVDNEPFIAALAADEINNTAEIARILKRTFPALITEK